MNDNDIRKWVLAGRSSSIRALLLTDNQRELVNYIYEEGFMTANTLSSILNVSIQNASSKLACLYNKGYLRRHTQSAESGGVEHTYETL